ncbi:hypothetical protein JCM6882_006952 [Rhodosporidiobolus microsporus]
MAAPFPALGDTFASLDDFKRAVYRACAAAETRMGTVWSSPDQACHLRCPFAGDGRLADLPPCTFRIFAARVPGTLPKLFKVTESVTKHSCDSAAREQGKEVSKSFVQSRLKALGEATPPPPAASAPAPRSPVAGPSRQAAVTPDPPSGDEDEDEDDSPRRSGRKRQAVKPFDELIVPASKRKRRAPVVRVVSQVGVDKGKGKASSAAVDEEEQVRSFPLFLRAFER